MMKQAVASVALLLGLLAAARPADALALDSARPRFAQPALCAGRPQAVAPCQGQVRNRWRLDWDSEKPEMFLVRSAGGQVEPYWFVLFEVHNPSEETIPLILDVVLYVETGKELMSDVRKVDSETIKDINASDKYDILVLKNGTKVYGLVTLRDDKYFVQTAKGTREIPATDVEKWVKRSAEVGELLKYGRYHPSIVHPEAEYKIIEYAAGLGNRSPGIVLESIEALKKGFDRDPSVDDPNEKVYLTKDRWLKGRWKKGDRLFLNSREIRDQKFIRPGQRLGGIAVFKNVNPRAQVLELQVSGLIDIIKVEAYDAKELDDNPDLAMPRIAYENRVLKMRYEFKGDEHSRMEDAVAFKSREWVVKRLGPVADKETLQALVDTMVAVLRREKEWKEQGKKPEEVDALRHKDGIGAMDLRIMAQAIRLATGKEFGYDAAKEILENEAAIWRIHEWWVTNKSRLAYNEITNRYEVVAENLPGTVEPKDK
ncbi:MAG: hypothetical protein HYY17_14770 [Planctomycetes bacterium]|nr:hypothetical protein [Planctomycetota bacterium]